MRTTKYASARRETARAAAVALLVGALAVVGHARADTEESGTAPLSAASRFEMRPSSRATQRLRQDPASGAIAMLGMPLRTIAAQGWGVHPLDVQSEAGIDLRARYDVLLRPEDGTKRAMNALLREFLPGALGLVVRIEEREIPLQILRRLDGVPALEPSTTQVASSRTDEGEARATKMPIADLVSLARWRTTQPVVDETGLDAEYDWVLQWDPSGGNRAFFLAFRDLGLELVPGERTVPILILSRAEP